MKWTSIGNDFKIIYIKIKDDISRWPSHLHEEAGIRKREYDIRN